jgi:chromosome segregation ATPase
MAQMNPILVRLNAAIEELRGEIKGNQESYEKEGEAVEDYESQIASTQSDVKDIEKEKQQKRGEFNAANAKPEQLRVEAQVSTTTKHSVFCEV